MPPSHVEDENRRRPAGTSQLCGFCWAMLPQFDKVPNNGSLLKPPHYGHVANLKLSAENGCALCFQFMYQYGDLGRRARKKSAEDSKAVKPISRHLTTPFSGIGDAQNDTSGGYVNVLRNNVPESYDLLYLPSSGSSGSRVRIFPSPENIVVNVPEISETKQTNTKDALDLCKEWLIRCEKTHDARQNLPTRFVPTRLVRARGPFPRLSIMDDLKDVRSYATLSHCCSQSFTTLSRANLRSFQERIPPEALSKTFLDAIFDDPDDWQKEAILMTKVYGGSHINIAASGAVDGSIGLFYDRSSSWKCRVQVPALGPNKLFDCVNLYLHHRSLHNMPLSQRGWALQERILPRRTILFAITQVFWECHRNITCESFEISCPASFVYVGHFGFICERKTTTSEGVVLIKNATHDIEWYRIVQEYTKCSLTFERDRLAAIAGLAREIQCHNQDEYIAASSSFLDYRSIAPSWSWASTSCPVAPANMGYKSQRNTAFITILEVITKLGEDPFGAISTAQLLVACKYLVLATLLKRDTLHPSEARYNLGNMARKISLILTYSNSSEILDIDFPNYYLLPVLAYVDEINGLPFLEGLEVSRADKRGGAALAPKRNKTLGSSITDETPQSISSVIAPLGKPQPTFCGFAHYVSQHQ
ncbi:hypothetical protein BDZ45DRAFT_810983 [Acephala macrosclerotiorum]|nr:hypothetical protein BDZ45DRAFT_810983 [Acephala macrosclerotiorum]